MKGMEMLIRATLNALGITIDPAQAAELVEKVKRDIQTLPGAIEEMKSYAASIDARLERIETALMIGGTNGHSERQLTPGSGTGTVNGSGN